MGPHSKGRVAPGDALSTGGYRWQVETIDGERLVVTPAPSGEVPTERPT